jgi:nucleoside-triphosphatase THEP1
MNIAYTMASRRGGTDRLLQEVAEFAIAHGLRTCGIVQINTECESGGPCDMDVQVLPDGSVIRISQSLGRGAQGCRLDSQALEEAAGQVAASLERGADLMIINKFGKSEAQGDGFRSVIAEAIARDVPVLVGLNAANEAAFETFSGGLAVKLAPETVMLSNWIRAVSEHGAVA